MAVGWNTGVLLSASLAHALKERGDCFPFVSFLPCNNSGKRRSPPGLFPTDLVFDIHPHVMSL